MKQKKRVLKDPSWYLKIKSSPQRIYERVWDKETCRNKIVIKEEYSLQEYIQAHDNSSDLALFAQQFNAGLIDPIEETNNDVVFDETYIPKSLIEYGEARNKVENAWITLDPTLKKVFGSEAAYREALSKGSALDSIIKSFSQKEEVKSEGGNN